MLSPRSLALAVLLNVPFLTAASADVFTVKDDNGDEVTVSARWGGGGREVAILEFPNGRVQPIPEDRIVAREPADDPTPLTGEELVAQLVDRFGAGRTVTRVEAPYVLAVVMAAPNGADRVTKNRVQVLLKKAGQFLNGVQTSFEKEFQELKIELRPLRYALPVVIFEADSDFDAYYRTELGEQAGLSAKNVASFYDVLSNRLVLRARECRTFDTPLHEAIHQLVYNRDLIHRLAPVPLWLHEGLASGFEGDGVRVKSGPRAVNERYASVALRARKADWADLVENDKAFQGDVLAAQAYAQSWGLHWLLLTRYPEAYQQILGHYRQVEPLAEPAPAERKAVIERSTGKSLSELQQEFVESASKARARKR
jgi:hypothetical protein